MTATLRTRSAHIVGGTDHVVPLQDARALRTSPGRPRRPLCAPMAKMTTWHGPVPPYFHWRRVYGLCSTSALGAVHP